MFHNAKKSINYWRLDRSLMPILQTRPIKPDQAGCYTAVSQVCKRDILMYLLAAKSFFRFVPPRRIVILNDGSLGENDCDLISTHLPGCEFVSIATIDSAPCPKRGTWERLRLVIEHSQTDYVIQLDSDTITLAKPTALIEHVQSNTSFAHGTPDGREIVPMVEHCARLQQVATPDSHVQVSAEASFPRLRRYRELNYVRGCSGFSGFGYNSVDSTLMLELNKELLELLGEKKWSEWGSEQVMSNLLVANSTKAAVLPYPQYGAFHPQKIISETTFLHFMGTDRFYKNTYGKLGRLVINELNQTDPPGLKLTP